MADIVNRMLLWKLAAFRLLVHCVVIAGTGYLGAMGNQTWASLDGDSRFKLLLGLGISVMGTIAAFLDKTVAKLGSGNYTPPDIGDSTVIQQSQTSSVAIAPAVPATSVSAAVPELKTQTDTSTLVTTPSAP